jgi:hypothetical protein
MRLSCGNVFDYSAFMLLLASSLLSHASAASPYRALCSGSYHGAQPHSRRGITSRSTSELTAAREVTGAVCDYGDLLRQSLVK